MSIRLYWLREHGVSLTVYSGKITPQMLLEHIRAIDPEGAPTARGWITYYDDTVDVSEIGLDAQIEARDLVAAKFREGRGEARLRTALVCRSRLNRPNLSLWQACTRAAPGHPIDAELFESLREACDWLGLDADARRRVAAIAEGRAEAVPAAMPEPQTAEVSA